MPGDTSPRANSSHAVNGAAAVDHPAPQRDRRRGDPSRAVFFLACVLALLDATPLHAGVAVVTIALFVAGVRELERAS